MKSGRPVVVGALFGALRMTRMRMIRAGRRNGRGEFMPSP